MSLVWKLDVDIGVLGFVLLRSVVKREKVSWRKGRSAQVTMSTN